MRCVSQEAPLKATLPDVILPVGQVVNLRADCQSAQTCGGVTNLPHKQANPLSGCGMANRLSLGGAPRRASRRALALRAALCTAAEIRRPHRAATLAGRLSKKRSVVFSCERSAHCVL